MKNPMAAQAAGVDGHAAVSHVPLHAASISPVYSVSCYENEVPPFVERIIDRLYGSLLSSTAWFRVYGGMEGASTYVESRNGEVCELFLYRVNGRQVRVLNEGMELDAVAVNRFAETMFRRYRQVDSVLFNAVRSTVKRLHYPFCQYACSEDSIVQLPSTPEGYFENFGKSMKKNLKYYLNRLKKDFPSFEYRVHDGKEVDERYIRGVVRLNRLRFASTGRASSVSPMEEDRIVRMIRECGMVGVATIDGEQCAGSLTYWTGEHCFSILKAHDPRYDDYRFGIILSYLMIRECISRGAKTFHFMWGRQPQKAQLQGVHTDLVRLSVFRSGRHLLRNTGSVVRMAVQSLLRETRIWLKEAEQKQDWLSRSAIALIARLKAFKRFLRVPKGSRHNG